MNKWQKFKNKNINSYCNSEVRKYTMVYVVKDVGLEENISRQKKGSHSGYEPTEGKVVQVEVISV